MRFVIHGGAGKNRENVTDSDYVNRKSPILGLLWIDLLKGRAHDPLP